MRDWYRDVWNFHLKFGLYVSPRPSLPPEEVVLLRSKLIREETTETLGALEDCDLVALADGIVDSIVVLLGTAISFGIDVRPLWDEVHRANMEKDGGGFRSDGKVLKPAGWRPPNIEGLLKLQQHGDVGSDGNI